MTLPCEGLADERILDFLAERVLTHRRRFTRAHAIASVVPEHVREVSGRRLELIAKTEAAVKERLTKEITYWDHRAEELKLQEQSGKANARLNSNEARRRADQLQARLEKRMSELKLEAKLSPLPPVVMGGIDLPLIFHPAATGAWRSLTPIGVG